MTADDYRATKSVDDLASEYYAKVLLGELVFPGPATNVVFPTPQNVQFATPQHIIVDSGIINATVENNTLVDMFGTLVVGSLYNQAEVHYDDANYANYVDIVSSGAGAGATQASGRVQFKSGTTTSGSCVVTTLDIVTYRAHYPTYAAFTAAFVTPPTGASDLAVLGLGDATNGLYIGYKGTTFGALYRKNGVDTFTAVSVAGLTTSVGNIFKVQVGLFGYAGGIIEWWNPITRRWQVIHTQQHSNADPFFTNFDLPMTLIIAKNASDATDIKINTACWGAGSTSARRRLSETISDNSLAELTQSVIIGKSSAGGTSYPAVKVAPSGAMQVGGTVALDAPTLTSLEADYRSLVERMGVRAPASGYHLWLDVTSSAATYIYVCEAPDGAIATDNTFRGIRITLDASGNPLGAVQTCVGFVWNNRASATWVN